MWELAVSEGGCSRLLIGSFYTVVKNAPGHSLFGSIQWSKTLPDNSLVAKFDEVDLVGFADRSCRLGRVFFLFFRLLDHVECGKEQL